MPLPPALKAFATERNYAALTTIGPDGLPSTQLMMVDADDDYVLVNTEVDRQKYKNVTRDPRVAVLILDRSTPYRYWEIRGRVVAAVHGDEALAQVNRMYRRYEGRDYPPGAIRTARVLLKIAPIRVHRSDLARRYAHLQAP